MKSTNSEKTLEQFFFQKVTLKFFACQIIEELFVASTDDWERRARVSGEPASPHCFAYQIIEELFMANTFSSNSFKVFIYNWERRSPHLYNYASFTNAP